MDRPFGGNRQPWSDGICAVGSLELWKLKDRWRQGGARVPGVGRVLTVLPGDPGCRSVAPLAGGEGGVIQ